MNSFLMSFHMFNVWLCGTWPVSCESRRAQFVRVFLFPWSPNSSSLFTKYVRAVLKHVREQTDHLITFWLDSWTFTYLNGILRKFFNSKWRRSRWIKLGSCIPRDDPLRRRYVSGQPTQWTKTSSLQMWEFFFIFGRWNKEIWNDMYAEIKSFGDDGQEDKFAYSIHN